MPRPRNLSPWAYWQLRLAASTSEPLPVAEEQVPAWRAAARDRLDRLLGPWPEAVPPDLEVLDAEDRGSYRREHVVFDAEAAMSVPAYRLVPHRRSAPGAAVLALHGHGPGKAEICALAAPAPPQERGGTYAHDLATNGYVVLAPDLRGFGERSDPLLHPTDGSDACDLNLVSAYAVGANPLSLNLWDLRCALGVLTDHPLVDPHRIGVIGFSYGATLALFLGALDERVRAVVVSGYLSSWHAAHRVPANLCGSQVLPGMLGRIEHLDVAALVAPRPMLVETGADDLVFPIDAAHATVADLRRVYHALGAEPGALDHHVFAGGHRWDGARVEAFLARWL